MPKKSSPNFPLLLLAQALSTIRDAFGQRASRVDHKGSSKRMMLSTALVSSFQMLICVLILEQLLPSSVTGQVFDENSQLTKCFAEVDSNWFHVREYKDCLESIGLQNSCSEIPCPRQGVSNMLRLLFVHPVLLLNGFMNLFYLIGETMLYKEPMGLVLIVIAALFSTYLISPLTGLMGISEGERVATLPMVLGIVGALLTLVEFNPEPTASYMPVLEEQSSTDTCSLPMTEMHLVPSIASPQTTVCRLGHNGSNHKLGRWWNLWCHRFSNLFIPWIHPCKVFFAFFLLSLCYALWFVLMKFYNATCRANVWSYNVIDQGLLPMYICPYLYAVTWTFGSCPPGDIKGTRHGAVAAFIARWSSEFHLPTVFLYRLFINTRAFLYTYMAVYYDINMVYLQIQILRVVMSWIASLVICRFAPLFINVSREEVDTVFRPVNVLFKLAGCALALASLYIIQA